MPTRILAGTVASISEFKANPMKVMSFSSGNAVAVLNHNEPAFYCIPPAMYEALMERLDDLELLATVREREHEPSIKVTLDELNLVHSENDSFAILVFYLKKMD